MIEKLGTKFLNKNFEEVPESVLGSCKVIAIYFGAKWSNACNQFLPKLLEFYNEVNKSATPEQKNLEIIYANFDNHESIFKSHLKDMPWLALPFKENQRIKLYLDIKEDIDGIPSVLIMKKDGNIAMKNGRGDIEKFAAGTDKTIFENWLKLVGL